jgi:hypothetical protein
MKTVAALFALLTSFFTDGSLVVAQEQPQVTGKWTGVLASAPYTSQLEMELEQKEGVVTGAHSITHAIGGRTTSGWVTGRIKGRNVRLNTEHAYFDLQLSDDGNLLKGDGRSSAYFQVELKRKE